MNQGNFPVSGVVRHKPDSFIVVLFSVPLGSVLLKPFTRDKKPIISIQSLLVAHILEHSIWLFTSGDVGHITWCYICKMMIQMGKAQSLSRNFSPNSTRRERSLIFATFQLCFFATAWTCSSPHTQSRISGTKKSAMKWNENPFRHAFLVRQKHIIFVSLTPAPASCLAFWDEHFFLSPMNLHLRAWSCCRENFPGSAALPDYIAQTKRFPGFNFERRQIWEVISYVNSSFPGLLGCREEWK